MTPPPNILRFIFFTARRMTLQVPQKGDAIMDLHTRASYSTIWCHLLAKRYNYKSRQKHFNCALFPNSVVVIVINLRNFIV